MSIVTRPAGQRVRVVFRGAAIADSREAVAMEEGAYAVVYYFPRQDVQMEKLARTAHSTHCPYKGDASYYSIVGGPDNAAWSYEAPKAGMQVIKGLLAFYPDKVDSISVG